MTSRFIHSIARLTIVLLLVKLPLQGVLTDLLVSDPSTIYIQWLSQSTNSMTDVDGDGNKAFNPFDGGPSILLRQSPPIDFFIGVMCNSLSGYEITLTTGSGTTTTTTGELTSGGGSKMTYSATLSKVNGTFAAGAVASANLDLTGSTASASAVFGSTADLPLEAASPNVWQLAASLPLINSVSDGLMMAGTYSGIITASVSLK